MMKKYSWGLVGYKTQSEKPHNIGLEIVRQISKSHQRLRLEKLPRFIQRQNGLFEAGDLSKKSQKSLLELSELPDVVFVALPSSDSGEPAYSLIKHCLEHGSKVITCEKGALANYFKQLSQLSDNFAKLGINASVGGGSRLMEKSKVDFRDPQNIHQIHLAINGTLTYIFSSIGPVNGQPIPTDKAVEQAINLGYAEPDETDLKSIIRGEAENDIPKKIAIFLNQSGLVEGNYLNWQKLKFILKDSEIEQVVKQAGKRRFIISVCPISSGQTVREDVIGGFDVEHANWQIIGGFKDIEQNKALSPIAGLKNAENGAAISLGPDGADGLNTIIGPGAGPKPTVNTMLDDYIRLISL